MKGGQTILVSYVGFGPRFEKRYQYCRIVIATTSHMENGSLPEIV